VEEVAAAPALVGDEGTGAAEEAVEAEARAARCSASRTRAAHAALRAAYSFFSGFTSCGRETCDDVAQKEIQGTNAQNR
jgi:hypothetical protein